MLKKCRKPLFFWYNKTMKTILVPVSCPNCGHEAYVKSEQFIIPEFHQKHREAILDGSFFQYRCPVCRTAIECIHDCVYHDHARHLLLILKRQGNEKEIVVETVEPIQRLVRTPLQLRETIRIFEDHFHDVPMSDLKARLLAQFKSRGCRLLSISYHDFDEPNKLLWFEVMNDHQQIDYRAVSLKYYEAARQRTSSIIDDTVLQEVTITNVMKRVNLIKND